MSSGYVLAAFALIVLVLLVIDLFVVHRRGVEVTLRSALTWSVVWLAVAAAFGLTLIPLYAGTEAIGDYFAVFVVEKSLSVDNVFLWLVVFTALGVPQSAQRRVLLFGILGALVLRFAAIAAGVAILEQFTWVLWAAGAFLIFTGFKMFFERSQGHEAKDDGESKVARLVRRVIPTTEGFRGDRFFVREGGKLLATPLLLALILVEMSDVVLALDALPATLGISTDRALVFSATGFALLGLRALFFLIAGVAKRLTYLKFAVAVILVYIGATLIIESVVESYHASTAQSLLVIAVCLAAAVVLSLKMPRASASGQVPEAEEEQAPAAGDTPRD